MPNLQWQLDSDPFNRCRVLKRMGLCIVVSSIKVRVAEIKIRNITDRISLIAPYILLQKEVQWKSLQLKRSKHLWPYTFWIWCHHESRNSFEEISTWTLWFRKKRDSHFTIHQKHEWTWRGWVTRYVGDNVPWRDSVTHSFIQIRYYP